MSREARWPLLSQDDMVEALAAGIDAGQNVWRPDVSARGDLERILDARHQEVEQERAALLAQPITFADEGSGGLTLEVGKVYAFRHKSGKMVKYGALFTGTQFVSDYSGNESVAAVFRVFGKNPSPDSWSRQETVRPESIATIAENGPSPAQRAAIKSYEEHAALRAERGW